MDEILSFALRKADEAEVFHSDATTVLARHSLDKIEACNYTAEKGYGVRVVRKGRVGFSFFTRFGDARKAVDDALRMAKLSPNERVRLPGKSAHKPVKCFDKKVLALTEDDVAEMVLAVMDGAAVHATPLKGEVSASSAVTHVMNSNGVDLETKETAFSAYSEAKHRDSVTYDTLTSRQVADPAPVGVNAGLWARRGAGAKPLNFEGRVCLGLEAIQGLFSSILLEQFDGELYRRGKTAWSGKLGERVAHPRFSLVEDALRPWGAGSASFDDEGSPTRKRFLIRNGVFASLVHDARSAALCKAKPTGNAFRATYSAAPEASLTNIIVEPRERCDAMRESGLFIRDLMGFHNANPTTGDFALTINLGFVLDGGELGMPVRGAMLHGNLFSLLRENPLFDRKSETRDAFTSPRIAFEGKVVK